MEEEIYSVSEVNEYAKLILERNSILNGVKLRGEITNLKKHYSGHWYFTLKDENASIKATMFKFANESVDFDVEDGMSVIIRGVVTIYERDGSYQINCKSMEEDGKGDLYIQFEKLKQKLEKEGLFDEDLKKEIPYLPKRVGVITAKTGAVVHDIINVTTRRFENPNLLIYPAAVQGKDCSETVKNGVIYFNKEKSVDVIIIARGGGSFEDLFGFNEEGLAREIAKSDIPVISAVGHETDFTICDFVSDLRAPTPSAAAELCYPSLGELIIKIEALKNHMYLAESSMIDNLNMSLKSISHKIDKYSPEGQIREKKNKIDAFRNSIEKSMDTKLIILKNNLAKNIQLIESLSPLNTLKRGYSVVCDNDDNIITSIDKIKKNDEIVIMLSDGTVNAEVKSKSKKKK